DMISDGAVVLHKLVVCQVQQRGAVEGPHHRHEGGVPSVRNLLCLGDSHTIHVEALNDSKVIGICVYNTTVMGLIGVVLEFALPIGSVDLRLVLLTCCINICSATTVLLVFGGKVGGQGASQPHRTSGLNRIPGADHPQRPTRQSRRRQHGAEDVLCGSMRLPLKFLLAVACLTAAVVSTPDDDPDDRPEVHILIAISKEISILQRGPLFQLFDPILEHPDGIVSKLQAEARHSTNQRGRPLAAALKAFVDGYLSASNKALMLGGQTSRS
uniref:G_PROTEIN_RECEP_F3_4 domain-containing protein n=1 Tax=Macrostomum lignano TaxID=282301 RepID=A0A1I8FJ47_9PLAT